MCSAPNKNTINVLRLYLGDCNNHTWGADASAKGFLFTNSSEKVNSTLVGYLYTKVQEILMKTEEMWWKMVKTAKKGTTTVLRVELSINWLKWCSFFCRVIVIQGGTMQNNVRMVWMPKDWEKYWESEVRGTYPETKTVLVRELTGELFLCCFKINTWGFYRGEGGCKVGNFYIRKIELKSKGKQGNTEKSKINQTCKNVK